MESLRPRQRACQSRPVGAVGVQLRRSAAAGVGFAGLQSCGSMQCPHCGSKIGAARREDITRGVTAWREGGGTILFGTLTLRHHRGQSLDALADAVSQCWSAVTTGRRWIADRKHHGLRGFVRVWETTRTPANGWHQHVHFVLFVDAGATVDTAELLASIFGRWSRKAVSLGLAAPLLRAQDLHEVVGTAEQVAEAMGGYLSKQSQDRLAVQTEQASVDTAKAIGWEVAGGSGKRAKGATPLELLDEAAAGNDDALSLWHEYELAMLGRRTVAWSRGLRDLLGLDVELTDEEIAAAEAGSEDDAVVSIPAPVWRRLVREGGRGPLIVYAGDVRHSVDQIVAWCWQRGWLVVPGGAPIEEEDVA